MIRLAGRIVRADIIPAAVAANKKSIEVKSPEVEFGISTLVSAIRLTLTQAAKEAVQRVVDTEVARHTQKFRETVRAALSIDLGDIIAVDDLVEEIGMISQRNAGLITNLGEDIIKRVSHTVSESVLKGKPAKELRRLLTEQFGFVQRRAKLIARDQTAKLTGDLNRLRQAQAGVKEYEWGTARDERVRGNHRAMEGKRCQWRNASVFRADSGKFEARSSIGGVELHPGEDIQCRCVAYAVIRLD